VQFYLYVYWAFIISEIFIFTPFGVIYPGFPTPALKYLQWWIIKDLEGSGRGLTTELLVSSHLLGGTEKNHQSGQAMFLLRLEPNTFRYINLLGKIIIIIIIGIRDSSVGLGTRVPFPAGARDFSPLRVVQTCSGAHPPSYPMGTGGSIPGSKAAGAEVKNNRAVAPLPHTYSWRGS
jgi:hypothetical protein